MFRTGENLRRARESKGQSLSEIAESTKIGRRYLEAIERGETDDLPGEVFVKGYIRTYAVEVGLDPERVIAQYNSEAGGPSESVPEADPVVQEMSRILERSATHGSGRGLWIAALVLVLGAAGVAGAWWFRPTEAPGAIGARSEPTAAEPVALTPVQEPSVDVEIAEVVEPEPEPEPATTSPEASEPEPVVAELVHVVPPHDESAITIPDHGVGTGIVDRRLVGVDEEFAAGTTVWFWTRVLGAEPGDTVRHVWLHEGQPAGEVQLKIGGAHWRTQSKRVLPDQATGHWVVEALDSDGRVLARDEFTVVAPG